MSDRTLDEEILGLLISLTESDKRLLLSIVKDMQKREAGAALTRDELWALPVEERFRRIETALSASQARSQEDLEGYRDEDFDDGDPSV